ncbi:MAG: hypothetical protein ACR2MP_01220 [Streptosporangiaceae bacterium]
MDRGASGAVIGTTMGVPAIHRFPVGSAVQVTEQAGDPPVLTAEPLT